MNITWHGEDDEEGNNQEDIMETNSRCECGGIRYTVGEVPPLEIFLK